MTKIKIIEKEVEIEGKIEKGKVTPFGTSAHIPFKKKYTGRIVDVIIPDEHLYAWLISVEERDQLLKSACKNINKTGGKHTHYSLNCVKNLKGEVFNIDSLIKVLEFVDDTLLVNKIKTLYNLNIQKLKGGIKQDENNKN